MKPGGISLLFLWKVQRANTGLWAFMASVLPTYQSYWPKLIYPWEEKWPV